MAKIVIFIAALFLCTAACGLCDDGSALKETKKVHITGYCDTEDDHKKYGNQTFTGEHLKKGTAAADLSRFPYGTEFMYKGKRYIVRDIGSKLVGTNRVDLYCTSEEQMYKITNRHAQIEIIKWGSRKETLRLLSMNGRSKYEHVRRMISELKKST